MMRKKILYAALALAIITVTVAANGITQLLADVVSFQIVINSQEQQLKDQAVLINDRTYLPLREIAESLDMNVEWSEKEQKINITAKKKPPVADGSELFGFYKDGVGGYMDINGKIRFAVEFNDNYPYYTLPFNEGYAIVEKYDFGKDGEDEYQQYCIIDINGNYTVSYDEFSRISFPREGLAVATGKKDGKLVTFFIDTSGNDVFGKYFLDSMGFSCGFAAVQIRSQNSNGEPDSGWTFINKSGNYATDMEFDDVGMFGFSPSGVAAVKRDGKWGLINTKFELISDYVYDNIWDVSNDGYITASKSGEYCVINAKGDIVIDYVDYALDGFSEGLCSAYKDGKVGYIDINGNVVIPFIYDRALKFAYGFAVVQDEGKGFGIINKNGEYVLKPDPKYEYIYTCDRGVFQVSERWTEKMGYQGYYLNTSFEKIEPHY